MFYFDEHITDPVTTFFKNVWKKGKHLTQPKAIVHYTSNFIPASHCCMLSLIIKAVLYLDVRLVTLIKNISHPLPSNLATFLKTIAISSSSSFCYIANTREQQISYVATNSEPKETKPSSSAPASATSLENVEVRKRTWKTNLV